MFFRLYIQCEMSQPKPNMKNIRAAFEEALTEFGRESTDLWLNYASVERSVGHDPAKSGVVTSRALSGLDPKLKELFIRQSVLVGTGGED